MVLEENCRKAADALKVQQEKVSSTEGALELLKKDTGDKPEYDMKAGSEAQAKLEYTLSQMRKEKMDAEQYCSSCKQITEEVFASQEKLKKSLSKKNLLDKLYNMVIGKYAGAERVSFERYVQTYYFNQVLEYANQKLMMLSGGRYQLVRRQEEVKHNTASGLNLDVMDYYTGKVRAAETLSGGETFLASLSLALGLSDAVQHQSGGIHLDAMFIDEGFGSLDSTALDQAVKLLEQLSDNCRMIGIISHVAELSERFESQIYVEKHPNGSRIRK